MADEAEQAVLDFVPLRGAGREVADRDLQPGLVGELLQLDLPQPSRGCCWSRRESAVIVSVVRVRVARPCPRCSHQLRIELTANWRGVARDPDGRVIPQQRCDGRLDSLVVTHPFHPLFGQRLEVLRVRRHRSGRLYVCDGGRAGQCGAGGGRHRSWAGGLLSSRLSVEVLVELAALVAVLGGGAGRGRWVMSQAVSLG